MGHRGKWGTQEWVIRIISRLTAHIVAADDLNTSESCVDQPPKNSLMLRASAPKEDHAHL